MKEDYFKVLVCGGRDYFNKDNLFSILDDIKDTIDKNNTFLNTSSQIKIINGGAKGADKLSTEWAKLNNINIDVYIADWNKYGNSAGQIRNKIMFNSSEPDIIVAFNGGRGTKNMIKLAISNGYNLEDLTKDKECQILYRA